jgi:hypothetical protein
VDVLRFVLQQDVTCRILESAGFYCFKCYEEMQAWVCYNICYDKYVTSLRSLMLASAAPRATRRCRHGSVTMCAMTSMTIM